MAFFIKYNFWLLLLMLSITPVATAQNYKKHFDEWKKYHHLQLSDSAYNYDFTVLVLSEEEPLITKAYTWYIKNTIQTTQGNYSGKLLHGIYSKYYSATNQLASKGSYKNGMKDGRWSEWYPNGMLTSTIIYKDGIKEGKAFFYDTSGKIIEECKFKKDKKHGKSYSYKDDVKQPAIKYKYGVPKLKKKKEKELQEVTQNQTTQKKETFFKKLFRKKQENSGEKK